VLSRAADSLRLPYGFAEPASQYVITMVHSHHSHSYPPSYYDDQMCLKPPLLLWVAVIYLSRAITLPVAMAIGHFAGVDSRAIASFRAFWSLDALIPSLIAVVILYALCRRVPTASRWVRWIWARGRVFLAVSAALDIALILIALIRQGEISDLSLMSLIAAAVDAYFLTYILAARRVRDAFAEFPMPVIPRNEYPIADTHPPAATAGRSSETERP
jgi:Protein of unknown function (DUF2919)